uniref:HP domain-containing protein n=1 Tax=Homalodisca liturata TaxID=320908 RepID=A0A1B6HJL8_9HEMI
MTNVAFFRSGDVEILRSPLAWASTLCSKSIRSELAFGLSSSLSVSVSSLDELSLSLDTFKIEWRSLLFRSGSAPFLFSFLRTLLRFPERLSNSEVEESLSGNLKSVLKKENKKGAEPERKSKDLHSILKVSRDKESSSSEDTETESEDDKPNANSDLIDLLHKVEAQARGERRISTSPERKKATLVMSNNKKAEEPDKLMNLKNLDQGKENYDVTRRIRRKRADGAELSEGDSSSSGGREVRKIIGNEAIARRRQAGLAREAAERVKKVTAEGALSKSRSHSAMNGDVVVRPPSGAEPSPLRRCRTQPMDECDEPVTNGVSIAQRLQALQKSGQTDWKKRISRLNPEEELPTTISINAAAEVLKERLTAAPRSPPDAPLSTTPLDERLGLLESSTQGWRRRVNPSDATQFSVAGRMAAVPPSPLPSPAAERKKKIPKPERFRSKGTASKDAQSMPTSPEVETTSGVFKRSISAPGDDDKISLSSAEGDSVSGPLVSVPKVFDDDFSSFFASSATDERIELKDEDLETVTSSTSQLLVQRRRVKIQRRHGASSNPVKALAARTDLRTEYVEVKSGVAHREEKRLRVEKLAKNSSMAVEALAGLASQEDFAAVQLRKAAESTAHLSPMLPYKELMLLQIKGRRHVQTRLVEPHYSSINQGDSYVLVTPSQVFHWVGEFSNVIERSRGAEIAQHIAQTRDMGCTATQVTTLQGDTPHKQFWQLLGADEDTAANYTGAAAGHPDEDELYELALTGTNMIYEVEGEELVPRMDCWGSVPRIEILDHNKVIVLDFGSELYIWMGKTVTLERRRTALRLGQELWGQGYDYSECDVCPLTQAKSLGTRTEEQSVEKSATKRPEWALLAKVTQHMETVLLREKFLDWPDFSRVIQVKTREKDKQVEGSVEVKACDAQPMVDWSPPEPDLQLEGSHLGRGTKYYDPETHRHFEVSTLSVTVWHVQEFDSTELDSASLGQLFSGDSYVIRWCYSVTVTGRELTGAPSRHSTVGRDRCCYWTWQGGEASTNDKGAAALLTVQLDQERGPQLRLAQGQEPPAFRQLFHGGLIVHRGRRSDSNARPGRWRLYMALGEEAGEAMLIEVTCSMRQLRSRACLVLLDTEDGQAYLWRGAQALPHTHAVALSAVEKLKERLPAEAGLEDFEEIDIEEISEGEEPKVFFEALGGHNRQLYVSLSKSEVPATHTPRLFRLTSVSGVFQATPVTPVCHHFPSLVSPFPYTQQDLYSARQPALFLLDAGDTLWLWQGWWADERERSEDEEVVSGTGVGEVRWQAERRAAMRTTLEYCSLHQNKTPPSAHLVWAGLEPLHFTNLFPTWTDRDDIAEINIRDGHKPGEVLPVQAELERLTVSVYPPAQLLQRPLPEGVDPTRLEEYLAPNHFKEVLGLSQEEFSELPAWKQNKLKQEKGLF